MDTFPFKQQVDKIGFASIADIYTNEEVEALLQIISTADFSTASVRKTEDLFAIRQFLKLMPETIPIIFNEKLKHLVSDLFGDGFFIAKSIYFDKPEKSNWFVSYHQDLTISVNKKIEIGNFTNWTTKDGYASVQPPIEMLKNNFTVRIHLDDTDENNGALKIVSGSHKKGIVRMNSVSLVEEQEIICNVSKGGVMIMRPLLLHASSRAKNNTRRRVIHIEFSDQVLPGKLQWAELCEIS